MTTITHEQFEAATSAAAWERDVDVASSVRAAFAAAGITIAPPEPPQGMVKLAREIAERETADWPAVTNRCAKVALAALQHAVREAEHPLQSYTDRVTGNIYIHQRTYLRRLGAIE